MGAGPANPYWLDVLALGTESPYAHWFDIDWQAPHARGRLVLPVLGDTPDAVLQRGELRPALARGRFVLRYFDHVFPLDPRTAHRLFAFAHTYAFPTANRVDALAWDAVRAGLLGADGAPLGVPEATAAVQAVETLAARSTDRARLPRLGVRRVRGRGGRSSSTARAAGRAAVPARALAASDPRAPLPTLLRRHELVAVRVEDPRVFAA